VTEVRIGSTAEALGLVGNHRIDFVHGDACSCRIPSLEELALPTQLTVDLHPFFRNDRAIDNAVRTAVFRAAREQVEVVEIICGKGSGMLRKRVLALLGQPHIRKLYRNVDSSSDNEGRILVRF
jgi:DNA-nicking Smr family endonuclease